MRFTLLSCLAFLVTGSPLLAENSSEGSAFSALKIVQAQPHGEGKKVAKIEAREGTPVPERWYILVNDPKDENGLHEYVVAGGAVVASRNVSQFAETIRPADVFAGEPLKVDSDRVARIAREYAAANSVRISSMNYELKKDGKGAALLWNVTCLDNTGKELGRIYVTASKGTVVSHDGFTAEPAVAAVEKPREVASRQKETRRAAPVPVATPLGVSTPEPDRRPDFLHRVGGSLGKMFNHNSQ